MTMLALAFYLTTAIASMSVVSAFLLFNKYIFTCQGNKEVYLSLVCAMVWPITIFGMLGYYFVVSVLQLARSNDEAIT